LGKDGKVGKVGKDGKVGKVGKDGKVGMGLAVALRGEARGI
jgi:hypothetical protein